MLDGVHQEDDSPDLGMMGLDRGHSLLEIGPNVLHQSAQVPRHVLLKALAEGGVGLEVGFDIEGGRAKVHPSPDLGHLDLRAAEEAREAVPVALLAGDLLAKGARDGHEEVRHIDPGREVQVALDVEEADDITCPFQALAQAP